MNNRSAKTIGKRGIREKSIQNVSQLRPVKNHGRKPIFGKSPIVFYIVKWGGPLPHLGANFRQN